MTEFGETYLLGNKKIIVSNIKEGIERLSHMLDSKQYLVRIKSSQSDYFAGHFTDFLLNIFTTTVLNMFEIEVLPGNRKLIKNHKTIRTKTNTVALMYFKDK